MLPCPTRKPAAPRHRYLDPPRLTAELDKCVLALRSHTAMFPAINLPVLPCAGILLAADT
jgi:hypothetical protein